MSTSRTQFATLASVLIAGAALLTASPTHAALVDDFIAGWTFDETSGDFTDVSGDDHTLFAAGNPYGNGSNGIVGGALDLDGENDWATSDDGTNLNNTFANFTKTDAFSISLWVNNDNVSEFKSFAGQWSGGGAGDVSGWALRNGNARDEVWFLLGDGEGNNNGLLSGADVLTQDTWHHIVATYDGSGSDLAMEIYVDGVSKAQDGAITDNFASDINNDNEPFAVGARENSEAGHIDGEIDEVGLWNRVLTGDEVSQLYNGGAGLSMTAIPEPATVALVGLGGMALLGRRRRVDRVA